MLEFFVPLVAVGLAALSILAIVTPPSMASFRGWLRHHEIDIDDHTGALVQVALLKACLVAVLAVVIAAGLGALLELVLPIGARWAYGSVLVLAIAVSVAASAVSFPGSPIRRATLAPRSIPDLASRRVLALAVALSIAVPVLAVVFGLAYRSQTRPNRIYPVLTAGPLLPREDLGFFAHNGALSVLLSVLGILTMRYTLRRPTFSQAGGDVDLAVRKLFSHRIVVGIVSGQLILLGTTLPGMQMLTLGNVHPENGQTFYTVSDAWFVVGVITGLSAVVAGVLLWALRSGVFHLWSSRPISSAVPVDDIGVPAAFGRSQ